MTIFAQLVLQLLLILLNAVFAAFEVALISMNEKKVRALAEDGNKKAGKMLKIIEDPTKFLSAIQIGITLAGFLGSAFAADNFAELITDAIIKASPSAADYAGAIDALSVIVVTLVLSYFTLVLGELVPKRVAMKYKDSLAGVAASVIGVLSIVLKPVIWFLTASTNLVLRLFRIDPNEKEESVSEEDIVIMLDAGADEGTLDENDIEYIKNVFKLSELSVTDVMTPRGSIVAAPKDISIPELVALIDEEGYSRLPIYDGDLDNVVGILHTRRFLLHYRDEGFKLEDVMFEPDYIPGSVHLDVVFKDMQKNHRHIVIAVNEFGSVEGVLTMEDILEEIVGEIWDEQDEESESITKLSDDTYKALSSISIDEFFTYFELPKNDEISSSTVNGWISEVCGAIAPVGFSFEYSGLEITVTEAEEQMTVAVNVRVLPETEEN